MTWPLVALSGLLDPNVYVKGYVPSGVDVGVDISQNLLKINELVEGANELNTNLATEVTAGEDRDSTLSGHTVAIQYNANTNSTQASQISALQGVIGAAERSFTTAQAPSPAEMVNYAFFICTSNSSLEFNLPGKGVDIQNYGSTPGAKTIINKGTGNLTITIGVSASSGHWGDGTASRAGDVANLVLTQGESVTVYPVPYADDERAWAIVAGKSYADLVT